MSYTRYTGWRNAKTTMQVDSMSFARQALRRDEPIHCDNRKASEVKTFIIWKLKSSRLAYNLDANQSSEPISR